MATRASVTLETSDGEGSGDALDYTVTRDDVSVGSS